MASQNDASGGSEASYKFVRRMAHKSYGDVTTYKQSDRPEVLERTANLLLQSSFDRGAQCDASFECVLELIANGAG